MSGRPSVYSTKTADFILSALANGQTLSEVCRADDMPSRDTIYEWISTNRDGFSDRYVRAREIGAYAMADDLLTLSDDGRNDWMANNDPANPGYDLNGEHVQRSKLRADTRKWLLSKVLPKVFGDKQQLEHTGAGGAALVPVLNVTVSRD